MVTVAGQPDFGRSVPPSVGRGARRGWSCRRQEQLGTFRRVLVLFSCKIWQASQATGIAARRGPHWVKAQGPIWQGVKAIP